MPPLLHIRCVFGAPRGGFPYASGANCDSSCFAAIKIFRLEEEMSFVYDLLKVRKVGTCLRLFDHATGDRARMEA